MARRHIVFRKARLGIESLEPRIAPTILLVNGGGNTPNGEASPPPAEVQVVGGSSTSSTSVRPAEFVIL
jgi:hypothetical protein